ncbi:MAG: leucine--tRNA ligase [Patescibacteria group bacterium]|jgi:leucyl-tRNA synthetase
MDNKYQPNIIEPKWQKYWQDNNYYQAADNSTKPKFYCLDMFPYPSANGLHVGHPEGYTATDIFSRYKRMGGFNVLHPMGWDAFGLPAENYAIKTGVDPDTSTHNNIKNFTRQIKALGFSYDWSREIDTSSPEYYCWTQWIFLQMYQHGLAYRKKAHVNWCASCQTVLANEQVVNGACERCKNPVMQKDLEQWFFRITDYADKLLADLDSIDWPEPIKLMQRNWIGKSVGINIDYDLENSDQHITVFTTRPDTNFGATFVVLAPDSKFVQTNLKLFPNYTATASYIEQTVKKTELERISEGKKKTGVFTGSYVINKLNNKRLPVYISDFVLASVGTGAVVGVPGHDVRDFEFAQAMGIEVIRVVVGKDGDTATISKREQVQEEQGTMINSDFLNGLDIHVATEKIMDYLEKQGWGKRVTNYKIRDWLISRQRYWGAPIPIVYDPQGNAHPIKEEHLPLLLPTDVDYRPKGTSPLGSSKSYKDLAEKLYGAGWHFEVDTMDTFVCSSWYYLRYCDPHNAKQFADPEKLKQWLPVDMYVGGAEHAVLHLLYARFFHKALQDFGFIPKAVGREPFKALRNQGMILGEDHQKMSKSRGNVVNPDAIVQDFGADTMRLYEMFMGPFEETKPWDPQSIKGMRRFLEKIWNVYQSVKTDNASNTVDLALHQTIKKVTEDIEQFKFNTAISQLMICLNSYAEQPKLQEAQLKIYLQLIYPFAPHLAEELREQKHWSENLFQDWPKYDETKLVNVSYLMVIQVNGKVRDKIELSASEVDNEQIIKDKALASNKVQQYISGKEIVKVIVVPKKLVSIVIK